MLGAGLVVGAIFVAHTYVASGGRASFDEYYASFALGFAIGVTNADVYSLFHAIGAARLAAAGAAAETRAAATTEAEVGQGLLAEERVVSEESIAVRAQTAAEGRTLARGAPEGTARGFHRYAPNEAWIPGEPAMGARKIDISLAEVEVRTLRGEGSR
jgi:hypothetical protein